MKSEIEQVLAEALTQAGVPYHREHKLEGCNYKWDFQVVDLLIEIQGGIWHKGGHNTGAGITRDCKKANVATLAGFRTLFFTSEMVYDGTALDTIMEAIG